MAMTPSRRVGEKYWILKNRKIVDRHVREARMLVSSRDQRDIVSALRILDDALAVSPRFEPALELKARSLLLLRRFKDVAEMLQDYIPSVRTAPDDSSDSENSSQQVRDRVKLLSAAKSVDPTQRLVKCFSVSDLKKKVLAGMSRHGDREGNWRYLVLGQACCHLGLLEDATVLLQTGKRLATAALRKESISWSDDSFSSRNVSDFSPEKTARYPPVTESEHVSQLLSHIKLLVRRKSAAIAAADAGLHCEAVRHFSKIVDGKRCAPQGFLADCFLSRASAYRSSGRVAESIADCNRTLALEPNSIHALTIRSSHFESIRCLPDCLHDLEHLKLLYNSLLRDRKLSGPPWKSQNMNYREIPANLGWVATKIQELKQRVVTGESGNIDYHGLFGLKRGCSRSELDRAYLLLCLRHAPEKAMSFIDRCEFTDDSDVETVKDRARISSFLLYKLIQKGYASLKTAIKTEEEETTTIGTEISKHEIDRRSSPPPSSLRGVFCRDIAAVSNLLLHRPLLAKYEGLSC